MEYRKATTQIINWAKQNRQVCGLILHGSRARNDYHYGSDVNLIAIIQEGAPVAPLIAQLKELFHFDLKFALSVDTQRIALYAAAGIRAGIQEILKYEIRFISDINEVTRQMKEPNLQLGETKILFSRDCCSPELIGQILDAKEEVKDEKDNNLSQRLHDYLFKALYYFEISSNYHRRSDHYNAVFNYNIALKNLVSFAYIALGGRSHHCVPRNFITQYLPRQFRREFFGLAASFNLREFSIIKLRFRDFLSEFLNSIGNDKIPDCLQKEVIRFLDLIIRRDYFYNIRDFAEGLPSYVRRNLLYRSSHLDAYLEPLHRSRFEEWLRTTQIRTIIDLRTQTERKERPYPTEFLKRVEYVVVSLDDFDPSDPEPPRSLPLMERIYWFLAHGYHREIGRALRCLANSENFPAIIHCYAGKDRTGVVIITLQLLLGVPEELIIQHYLFSGSDTRKESAKRFLNEVRAQGLQNFLEKCGINAALTRSIRLNFLEEMIPIS